MDRIWYFESHLLATSDVELIKQHLRLIIDKIKGGGVLMAEDKFAVEYFSSAFSLASSFYDGMSHQIVFGPIYEELIHSPWTYEKNKNRGRRRSFVKGQVFVREYSHVRHKPMVEVRRIRLQRRARRCDE